MRGPASLQRELQDFAGRKELQEIYPITEGELSMAFLCLKSPILLLSAQWGLLVRVTRPNKRIALYHCRCI